MPLSPKSLAQGGVIGAATLAAVALPGSPRVQHAYATAVYPALQSHVTAWSNGVAWPIFDLTLAAAGVLVVGLWSSAVRRARTRRSVWPLLRASVASLTCAAVLYLWFLLGWGLNYARPALESVMAYDPARVSPGAVQTLAEQAVREANRTHAAAHIAGFPAMDSQPTALAAAVRRLSVSLGRAEPLVLARPKRSLLSPYFRAAGVSGMLAPFWLETLLNPDLTGPERPFVLGHEWAHLAGFAPESDASFVGLLAALGADAPAQYSAWLELVSEASNQLPPVTRQLVLARLDSGPRDDLRAIADRLRSLVRPVEHVAWATYDRALKSQGVTDGMGSYSRVVQLVLGTNALGTQP